MSGERASARLEARRLQRRGFCPSRRSTHSGLDGSRSRRPPTSTAAKPRERTGGCSAAGEEGGTSFRGRLGGRHGSDDGAERGGEAYGGGTTCPGRPRRGLAGGLDAERGTRPRGAAVEAGPLEGAALGRGPGWDVPRARNLLPWAVLPGGEPVPGRGGTGRRRRTPRGRGTLRSRQRCAAGTGCRTGACRRPGPGGRGRRDFGPPPVVFVVPVDRRGTPQSLILMARMPVYPTMSVSMAGWRSRSGRSCCRRRAWTRRVLGPSTV